MSIQNSGHDKGVALILGARSWIGYHLAQQLQTAGWKILLTSSHQCVVSGKEFLACSSADEANNLLEQFQPHLVVNLLVGISESEYAINATVLRYSQRKGAFYVFASSALALDGYKSEPLVESLLARSVSDYGIFKGRCEQALRESSDCSYLILRFSSIHGWSPYKATRTVNLLEKIRRAERVEVSSGVIQNRLTDQALVKTISSLIAARSTGIAHLGTDDHSEELDFLRKLAETFGYSSETIVEGEPRPVNLAVVPELGRSPDGRILERDTLNQLLSNPQLQQYKKSNG